MMKYAVTKTAVSYRCTPQTTLNVIDTLIRQSMKIDLRLKEPLAAVKKQTLFSKYETDLIS